MRPQDIYFIALALIVAPSMWLNRSAFLIASVWAVAQFPYLVGIDVIWLDAVLDFGALMAGVALLTLDSRGMGIIRHASQLVAVLLFAPMFAVHSATLAGVLHPYYAWWYIYWLALMQITMVLPGNDWSVIREGINAWRNPNWIGHLLRVQRP